MDASYPDKAIPPGIYKIIPLDADNIAKMDVWIAKITVLSKQ